MHHQHWVGRAAERCLDASSSVGGGRRAPPRARHSVRWKDPHQCAFEKVHGKTIVCIFNNLSSRTASSRLSIARLTLASGKNICLPLWSYQWTFCRLQNGWIQFVGSSIFLYRIYIDCWDMDGKVHGLHGIFPCSNEQTPCIVNTQTPNLREEVLRADTTDHAVARRSNQ